MQVTGHTHQMTTLRADVPIEYMDGTLGEANEKLSLRLRDGLLRAHLRAIRFPGSSF